ncbi:hypothetical protein ACLBWZ_11725 [Brucellaceae bacterium C25G]
MESKVHGPDKEERHGARQTESEKILARIKLETGSGLNGQLVRSLNKKRDHLSARDLESEDPIEIWATRIGRILGLIIMFAMISWLFFYLFSV